jgi:PmbA protein
MTRETYAQRLRQTAATVAESEVRSIRRKDVLRTGLRLYSGGVIGVAGAVGDHDPAELEGRARDSMGCGVACRWDPSTGSASEEVLFRGFPEDSFTSEVDALLAALAARHPEFVFSNTVTLTEETETLSNDAGLDLRSRLSNVEASLTYKVKGSPNIIDGWLSLGPCRAWDREGALDEMSAVLEAFDHRVEAPTGRTARIVLPWEYTGFLTSKLTNELNGRTYGSGASLFAGELGRKRFGSGFTAFQRRSPSLDNATFFDMEGVTNPGHSVTVVEDGVIRAVTTDKRTAAEYGLALTGYAHSAFDGIPSCAGPALVPASSGRTLEELLEGEPGILVGMTAGGDFSPDGSFSAPLQLAFLHDGRRFLGRLPELQVSSHLLRMLGDDWIGLSSDSLSAFSHAPASVVRMEVTRPG